MTRSCVANASQQDQRRPSVANARQRVCAGQTHNANDDQEHQLSVPRSVVLLTRPICRSEVHRGINCINYGMR